MPRTTRTLRNLLLSLFTAGMLLTGCTDSLVGSEEEKQSPVQVTEETTVEKRQHENISASNRATKTDTLATISKSRFITRRLSSQF